MARIKDEEGLPHFMFNPTADLACGTNDPDSLFPTPVHYNCDKCKGEIITLLVSRYPISETQRTAIQESLFEEIPTKKVAI